MRLTAACLIFTVLAAPLAALAGPAAQPAPAKAAAAQTPAARLNRAADLADQDLRSEALNAAVTQKNAAIQARNDAAKAAYDKATAEREAQASAAKAAYDAQVARRQAEVAVYDAALAQWKLRACRGGDRPGCEAQAVKTAQ